LLSLRASILGVDGGEISSISYSHVPKVGMQLIDEGGRKVNQKLINIDEKGGCG